ncbi:MAG TPA: hypothetical protein DDY78_09975 [Planctomycetales bacterium]|jgi:hypothetical protein|nr:hypothetical protein [Planctomycetales bacterium]
MSQGTEHHVEEAEHAQHAARNPFDRRVALSMAIVAAALASVTLLSHRSHNEVTVKKTEESDAWNYYQAKKNRGYMYAADAELLEALDKEAGDSPRRGKTDELIKKWQDTEKRYDADAEKLQEDAKKLQHEGHVAHISSNFFDLGELGIEIALVLCSVALLAKRKEFWLIGISVGALGFVVAMGGFFVEQLKPLLQMIGWY